MNGIAGIYFLNGKLVDRKLLAHMIHVASDNGTDNESIWFNKNIGLGHCQLHMTSKFHKEKQPFSSASGDYRIAFDGRIDNCKALYKEFADLGFKIENFGDVGLTLQAYEVWGTDCARKIIGDYAFVIWDSRLQRLFCARDAMGVRPFYYFFDGTKFIFGSTIRQLFCDPLIPRVLNEEYLADYLVLGSHVTPLSPYKNISKLLPGHSLVIENNRLRTEQFWNLDPNREILYTQDEDYEEHLLELIRESVRYRLRSCNTVWSELSGGLDSSSIVCIAHEVLKQENDLNKGFASLTVIYDQAPDSDERVYSRCIVSHCDLVAHYVASEDLWPFKGVPENLISLDEPSIELIDSAEMCYIKDLLKSANVRVLLSGTGGDQMFQGYVLSLSYLGDYLRRLRLGILIKELKQWAEYLDSSCFELFFEHCIKPIMPYKLQTYSWFQPIWEKLPIWITPSFRRRLHLEERLKRKSTNTRCKSLAAQDQYNQIMGIPAYLHNGYLDQTVEIRYPFLYRPLIEFAMAIPMTQKLRPGETRSILRRAMCGILPEFVRTRVDKRGPDQAIYMSFRREWKKLEQIINNSKLVELGYVDYVKLKESLELARQGYCSNFRALLITLSLELWLCTLEGMTNNK